MFDTPVYKILANNDTGAAAGHQGGFVIPKDLEDFFPDVVGKITNTNPTADVPIDADLFVDGRLLARIVTRYQYQTWGGTRTPERRLTSNLGPLRNQAQRGDVVLFARDDLDSQRMSVTLIRSGTPQHSDILRKTGGRRWGTLPGFEAPVRNSEIRAASSSLANKLLSEFSLFDSNRMTVFSTQKRKAREAAFRRMLILEYGDTCQITSEVMRNQKGLRNLDAAHIVPVEQGGSDDIRNGLLLGKDIHWAFDKGLFGISKNYEIKVKKEAIANSQSNILKSIDGSILKFGKTTVRPHKDAIAWHCDYWEI